MNTSLPPKQRAELLLYQMTLQEKVALVTGDLNFNYAFYNKPNTRLGIPALTMADGPAGVRIANPAVNEQMATELPSPLALAATWDPTLAGQFGDLMGNEAFLTGHNVMLSPALDIARVSVGGRTFEGFGEDPLLSGRMGVAEIQGIQSHSVEATAKHYDVNNQETNRMTVNAQVDERTLQEIYTLPFASAVKDGNVAAAMCAYNKINGTYACENTHLLTDILKQQLGFQGWVMSDSTANHSTVASANAGLDQEQPAGTFWGKKLQSAVQDGQVSKATLNDKVLRILQAMFAYGLFDQPVQIGPLPVQQDGQTARQIADQAIVLLKNASGTLPLTSSALHSIAVIGPDADDASAQGGGSSRVEPTYTVSPLDGISQRAGDAVQVEYAAGVDPISSAALNPGDPAVPSAVLTPAGATPDVHGLHAEYWTNQTFMGTPYLVRTDPQADLNLGFLNYPSFRADSPKLPVTPTALNGRISVRWTGSITAPTTGAYTLSLTSAGTSQLYLDNQLVIDNPAQSDYATVSTPVSLVAGQAHTLKIKYAADSTKQSQSGVGAQIRFGWTHPADAVPATMQAATDLAHQSDVAVVVVRDYSSESQDRPNLDLPNEQDQLIREVAAANPNTIVVLTTSAAVKTSTWQQSATAILDAWYPGQEQGNAIADVLFGDVNPAGKLPVTFPVSEDQTPVSSPSQYPGVNLTAQYTEGLGVGYRGYDQFGLTPQYPFGYGLSYTSFAYSQLACTPSTLNGTTPLQVNFRVTNTGSRAGTEVAQVYLGLPASTGEPPKRLVGWVKVQLNPGQTKPVTVTVDPAATARPFSDWNVNTSQWEITNGAYQVYVGASSRDISLTSTVTVAQGSMRTHAR
ncbi:MAG: glycoside hydrolase family 3 C-terminal domain-containing protein [Herpetosiphonaceae bacterium]|nr:glycoside hydrolase family 3 C-terminal domain-containing protein [Herpetosiphonaceae bacterium]